MSQQRAMSLQTRANWMIDAAVFLTGILAALSGIYFLIFTSGGYQGGRNPLYGVVLLFERATWEDLHTWGGVLVISAIAFNQMAENLDHAESLRREMTADIAHELRTPLAVMQARVEAILDGIHPAKHENLQQILEQTLLLNRLVDDLRTLSLAESGQLTIQSSQVELNSLVRRAAELFREEAASASVVLIVRIEDGAPIVAMVDLDRMEQVLGNIISNAIRYSPQKGEVEISLFRNNEKDLAMIEIGDRGEGIPEEALPHLFERFYRAPSDSRMQISSTGLGLAITRKLVEAHEDEITAANRPGGGALFTIKIPLSKA